MLSTGILLEVLKLLCFMAVPLVDAVSFEVETKRRFFADFGFYQSVFDKQLDLIGLWAVLRLKAEKWVDHFDRVDGEKVIHG